MSRPSRRGPAKPGYLSEDTIAAVASALGGAVAVVRVSGPETRTAAARLAGVEPSELEHRVLRRRTVRDLSGRLLDDAMVVFFEGPRSLTGEDVAEFHLHGSPLVASRLLRALADLGARQALAGEFSFRAVRNGKSTLSQAQAVADLIGAANVAAAELALEKLGGSQARIMGELAEGLRKLAAMGELGIDFSDQDLEELSLDALKARNRGILARLREIGATYERGSRIQDGISVAFLGLPNAGKSSLFNALLGEDRSIVTEIEGTTRDVVREKLTLGNDRASVTFRLSDTAGLRDAQDRVEKIGLARSLEAALNADLVLWVVDGTGDLARARSVLESASAQKRALGVLTKWDLLGADRRERVLAEVAEWPVLRWLTVSSMTGDGVAAAAKDMVELAEGLVARDAGELVLTRLDHLRAVEVAIEHLDRAERASELDLFAADLRQALHALSPVIGETVPDDILGKIFSEFCIGK